MYPGGRVSANEECTIQVVKAKERRYIPPDASWEPGQPATVPVRPEDEWEYEYEVRITTIDDKGTAWVWEGLGADSAFVLPGKHRVRLDYSKHRLHASANLWLVCEPGDTYVAKVRSVGYRIRFWFEDKRTGKVVGGIVGSSDEPPR